VETEGRRGILRLAAAAGLGALAAALGLRRGESVEEGYCDRAGRCGGCPVTDDCDVYQAIKGGDEHGR
jgi:hypothetical protein